MRKITALTLRIPAVLLFLLLTGGARAAGEEKQPLRLSFTGDLMAHSINYQMKDYSAIYRNLGGLLQRDDLTFGNVEFPMDPSRPMASFPSFNIHPAYVQAFIDAGLDVFSLANNHIADIGLDALFATRRAAETLAAENARPLYFSGIAPESERGDEDPREGWSGYEVTEIVHKGWKIGFLALSQKSNNPVSRKYLYQVDYRDETQSAVFIDWLKETAPEYDLFIISYHGGIEYNFVPDPGKKRFFEDMAAAGADIVWGQHPHVLQPVELVETHGGTGVIFYSLGNFLSGQGRIIDETLPEEEWSYTGDSAIIQVTVSPGSGERPEVSEVHPVPIANYITPNRDVLLYPLEDLVLQPLPPPWDQYYRERLRIMTGYFLKNITGPVPLIAEKP